MRKLGVGVLAVVAGIALGGCAAESTGGAASGSAVGGSAVGGGATSGSAIAGATSGGVPSGVTTNDGGNSEAVGDPNAGGRQVAAGTVTAPPPGSEEPAMPGGSMSMCANETLQEAMARSVTAGSSIVLATGGFTGNTTTTADGESGVVYSEVQLDVDRTLAGASVPESSTVWVFGDLAGPAEAGVSTGEASSLWAAGGRMIAIVDAPTEEFGPPGPVIRVAPVVGDQVILSWVGCWPTSGITTTEFDGEVNIFDERGANLTDTQLLAASLADFEAALPR